MREDKERSEKDGRATRADGPRPCAFVCVCESVPMSLCECVSVPVSLYWLI